MKWTLFVMLFITPPYSLPKGADKHEEKHLWSLQSTSTMSFDTQEGCMQNGRRIYLSAKPVANLTFRGLCLCESVQNDCPAPSPSTQGPPVDIKNFKFNSLQSEHGRTGAFAIPLD